MKSKVAGIQLSLWCKGESCQCCHLKTTDKVPMFCKYFGKVLTPDIRLYKTGYPMRLDVCLMADLAHDVYEVADDKEKDWYPSEEDYDGE